MNQSEDKVNTFPQPHYCSAVHIFDAKKLHNTETLCIMGSSIKSELIYSLNPINPQAT